MQKKWRNFERLVAAIHQAESEGAKVTWNDKINDRQFDVTIRFKVGIHDYLTVIECKDYAGKIPVEKVEALVTKAHGVNANKIVMVSQKGYQSGCFGVAERYGVSLLVLNEKVDVSFEDIVGRKVTAINVYSLRLLLQESKEYELEEEAGKLQFLMENITIKSDGVSATPTQLINAWQLDSKEIDSYDPIEGHISLPTGSLAQIPYEEALPVLGIKFQYKLTDAIVPDKAMLDIKTMEKLQTKYDLVDETGSVVNSTSISDINLGFDTELQVGKFYYSPCIGYYYFCERITTDLNHLVLVESYQHGRLIQARLSQKKEWSGKYLEVTDKAKIASLQKLLQPLIKDQ